MRNAQKNQILEIIDSLRQAHEEIGKALQKKGSDPAQGQIISRMLGECQETAVLVGESIEKTEGEEHITVSYLEEYCELLFRIHEEISGGDYRENKIGKSLRKQLIKIENSVKNDIDVRKEVAFFPYKASMWDSLESVYLAAREDPDCDAYCVPIPYYDLRPDHSFGEMHYEGGVNADGTPMMYPKNIEITDWQEYNFEERRPDVIYIHNGYDNWNLVTSVHPRFYAKNLKEYTDKLVYIPYFVLSEIEPDDQAAIDGMKHFCFMPGTIYADRVVVQSEKMRQIYINEYIKAAKETGLFGEHTDRKFQERKFLGTGSPKIDKVLRTKKEDLEIPEEWLRIIEKPDGSWKKIVFYNTSVSALLQHNEKMLQKMESVFEIFRENQNEVALLWRPHPLIRATIESMRPQLWEGYKAIKDKYIEESWGIYDDTPDVDRAVIMSDAYYGDSSSVVRLCQMIEMPVMLQDMDNSMFVDSAFFVDGEDFWLLTSCTDVLLHFSLRNMTLIEYFMIPVQHLQKYVHYRMENTKEGIYILPHLGNNIFYFNKYTKSLKEIALPPLEERFVQKRKIRISAFWNGELSLLGYDIPFVYFLNEDSGKIVADQTYLDIFQAAGAKKRGTIFSHCSYQDKNKLYVPLIGQAFIVSINLDERSFHCFRVTEKDEIRICTIDKYEGDETFLLTTYEDEKIIWSPKDGVRELQKIGLLNERESYLRAFHIGDKNYYIPANEQKIYVEQGKEIREIPYECAPNTKYPEHAAAQYGEVYLNKSEIYFQTRSGELFVLDTEIDEIHTLEFHVSSDKLLEIKREILRAREIPSRVMEQSCFCLKDYLKRII
ncbi:MAG: hypothetical protein NC430_07245 [bacterium]|nr:hypothetical protein [bacterium]MCM1423625.1 hypothetical protein [bacterium]